MYSISSSVIGLRRYRRGVCHSSKTGALCTAAAAEDLGGAAAAGVAAAGCDAPWTETRKKATSEYGITT